MSWLTNIFSKNETVPGSEKPKTTAADYCEQGEKSFAVGKYVEAMEYFQAAIETDRRFEKAYLLLVASYEKQGNVVKAKATLYALLAIDPENGAALKKLEQLSQTPQPTKNNDTPTEISLEEAPPTPQTNNTKPTQTNSNYSTSFRVIASTDSDVFDFFIVFDNGNRLYFRITNHKKNEVAVVPPTKAPGYLGSNYWDGYKRPRGHIVIPSVIDYNGKRFTVNTIDDNTFENSGGMTSVKVPDSVTSIGAKAFADCLYLETIELPPTLVTIGASCFADCGINTINLPNSITFIGPDAFLRCNKLTSFRFPERIDTIQEQTLAGCRLLTTIYIPSSVKEIELAAFGDGVFAGYYGADHINLIMETMTPPKVSKEFINSHRYNHSLPDATIVVPKGAAEAYMNAQYWQLYDIQEK